MANKKNKKNTVLTPPEETVSGVPAEENLLIEEVELPEEEPAAEPATAEVINFCSNCGTQASVEDAFCKNCGNSLK